MTINLTVPQTMQELRPRITVVGVGGAGCNAVNNMIDANLEGVDFLVANTDGQSLAHSLAPRKIQLGTSLTGGLGAGSKPEMGRKAAEESLDDVMSELADSNMVFITAGMGGGTGTGAAPVIAKAARERGILTVGVVTKPFDFEGKRRMEQADAGVEALQGYVDTLIVIPNQNLFRLANERTTLADTFHMADAVLHQGVCGVTDLMIKPGLINLDFADIRAVMSEMGKAMMGTGEASGENRAIEAAESAINNPLLDDTSMKGAKAVLINITGGMDMTLFEVDEAANRIKSEVDPDAIIIFGSAFDEKLEGVMRVSVVATGIDAIEQTHPLPFIHETVSNMAPNDASISVSAPAFSPEATQLAHNLPEPSQLEGVSGEGQDQPEEQISAELPSQMPIAEQEPDQRDVLVSAEAKTDQKADENLQMDIESAVEKLQADDTNIQMPGISAPALPDSPQPRGHEEAHIIRRPIFIPEEAKDVGQDDEVVPTAPLAEQSRQSLINRISGLWSAKPAAEQDNPKVAQTKEEPVLSRSDVTLPKIDEPAIMDLPKADMVQTSLPVDPVTKDEDNADDDLDIPAFLRRQAN